jgi:protein subunit release factor A
MKASGNESKMNPASTSLRPELDDDAVRRDCRWEAFRGPGPGGQKRNKTSSAVRVTHVPSGLSALAGESRSQARNRAKALERLTHRMAVGLRPLGGS